MVEGGEDDGNCEQSRRRGEEEKKGVMMSLYESEILST